MAAVLYKGLLISVYRHNFGLGGLSIARVGIESLASIAWTRSPGYLILMLE